MKVATKTKDQPESITIGELARRAGVTTRTVRYYEEVGILKGENRAPNGYRMYAEHDLFVLRLVLRGKRLGLSLAEIKEQINFFRQDPSGKKLIRRSIENLQSHIDKTKKKQQDLEGHRLMLEKEMARLQDLLRSQTKQP